MRKPRQTKQNPLSEIGTIARDTAALLSDSDYWRKIDGIDVMDFATNGPMDERWNNGIELGDPHLLKMGETGLIELKSRLIAMESTVTELRGRVDAAGSLGPESTRPLFQEGAERIACVHNELVRCLKDRDSADPDMHQIRVTELMDILGVADHVPTNGRSVEVDLQRAVAAVNASERLAVHGRRLGEWADRVDRLAAAMPEWAFLSPEPSVSRSSLLQDLIKAYGITDKAAQMRIGRGVHEGLLENVGTGQFTKKSVEAFLGSQKEKRKSPDPFEIL